MEELDDKPAPNFTTLRLLNRSGLPSIPGIFPLSKTEIKKDVREMERSMHDETDSDGSVLSEDVLTSIYPVKPRKVPKASTVPRPSAMSAGDGEDGEYDSKLVEQTLTFLDAIKRNKKDLYNAECERERFESQGVAYRSSIEDDSRRFKQDKRDEGNYVRVMQGFHGQALRLQMVLNRQNSMYYDLLNTLQRRKEAAVAIAADTTALKAKLEAATTPSVPTTSRVSKAAAAATAAATLARDAADETSVLRVHLQKSGREVVLYKGEWLRTPMGDGQVVSIQPADQRLVIQLPFGKLYANIRRAVCWCLVPQSDVQLLDLCSDDVLRQRWLALQGGLGMPTDVARSIRTVVGVVGDDDAATDKDDDQSNDDSPVDDPANGGGDAMEVEKDVKPVSGGPLTRETSTDHSQSDADRTAAGIRGLGFPLVGDRDKSSSESASSSSSASAASANGCTLPAPVLSRHSLRRQLCATGQHSTVDITPSCQRELDSTLPFIFAPPASFPALIEMAQATDLAEVRCCAQAFAASALPGSIGELAWKGDVREMTRELVAMQDEICRLESEQNHHISQVQAGRSLCAQLSTDTSSLRLVMFTRRVRHRNNLNAHVLSIQPAPTGAGAGAADTAGPTNGSATGAGAGAICVPERGAGAGSSSSGGVPTLATRGSTAAKAAGATASSSASSSSSGGSSAVKDESNGTGSRSSSRLGHSSLVTAASAEEAAPPPIGEGTRKRGRDSAPVLVPTPVLAGAENTTNSRRRSGGGAASGAVTAAAAPVPLAAGGLAGAGEVSDPSMSDLGKRTAGAVEEDDDDDDAKDAGTKKKKRTRR